MHDAADEISPDDFDDIHYPRPEATDFEKLVDKMISRRGFLGRGAAFAATAFVMSAGGIDPLSAFANADRFGFEAVPANTRDTVTVPRGYSWHVVARWGDPMWTRGPAFDHATRGTGASQELAFGDNNDGMALFHALAAGTSSPSTTSTRTSASSTAGGRRKARDPRRRAKEQGRARGVDRRDRIEGRQVVDRQGFRLQPQDNARHADGDHRPRPGARPHEDGRGPQGRSLARHLEQLRERRDAVGHVSRVRGEFSRLFRIERPEPEGQPRVQALRRGRQGLGIPLGDDG